MKKRLINLLDRISTFIFSNTSNSKKTFYELSKINFKESAEFINQHGSSATLLENKELFWQHAINLIPDKGMILEFGVYKGNSINFFSRMLVKKNDPRKIFGFDSFQGLSEDWSGTNMLTSTFDQKGRPPKVDSNVKLIKGEISETLPIFIKENRNEIAFMHMDMDTYSPTKLIFDHTFDCLQPGSVIVFDQLLGYPGWKNGEYKALMEVIEPHWNFQYISFCEPRTKGRNKSSYVRAAIKITDSKTSLERQA